MPKDVNPSIGIITNLSMNLTKLVDESTPKLCNNTEKFFLKNWSERSLIFHTWKKLKLETKYATDMPTKTPEISK